ncbi:MAG: hypothetical protein IPJ77_10605 [Planctomycetes bacterium]|nr:hypothetical protein [Planctomycetota bacterium]
MLFAVLVFALLGIAALTVDIGFATLSQAQMQTAADTAALEGVRLRDFHEYRPLSDRYRRARVSELVQDVNDDDLHPTGGVPASPEGTLEQPADDADTLRLGAGPVIRLSGGIGSANASALIETPDFDSLTGTDAWVDDPRLEVNRRNVANGDMLSGTFQRFASHAEDESYAREDFTPALWVGTDQSESFRTLGFLVRMRRTTGENALDEVPLIATRGPSLPFLFGMGTSIHAASGEVRPAPRWHHDARDGDCRGTARAPHRSSASAGERSADRRPHRSASDARCGIVVVPERDGDTPGRPPAPTLLRRTREELLDQRRAVGRLLRSDLRARRRPHRVPAPRLPDRDRRPPRGLPLRPGVRDERMPRRRGAQRWRARR